MPEDLPEEVTLTVKAIVEISGKSIQSLHRAISILKLFVVSLSLFYRAFLVY
jgi:hypothetical protein